MYARTCDGLSSPSVWSIQAEADNQSRMAKIVKKRPAKRDLQALRAMYEEAVHNGFAHGQIPKAASILAWDSSPTEVVLEDQAAMRARGECSRKASGCPRDSFPLLAGCQVAACVHVSDVGEGGSSTLVKHDALERALPELLAGKDLKSFNKSLKAMAKQRGKVCACCTALIGEKRFFLTPPLERAVQKVIG